MKAFLLITTVIFNYLDFFFICLILYLLSMISANCTIKKSQCGSNGLKERESSHNESTFKNFISTIDELNICEVTVVIVSEKNYNNRNLVCAYVLFHFIILLNYAR